MRTVFEKYKKIYDSRGKTESVLEHYTEDIQTILKDVILNVYNKLTKYEIYDLTQSAYSNRYGCSWENVNDVYEELLGRYEDITLSEEERNAARTARRQNRGRLVGGGFGLEGAAKGIATAGTFNMAAGALHGTANLIGSGIDKLNSSMLLSELYKETKVKEMLAYAIVNEVEDIYEGFRKCINENHRKNYFIDNFNESKATALFDNARKIRDKREELLVQSLKEDPFDNGIYKYILKAYGDEDNELQRMSDLFVPDSFNMLSKKLELLENELSSFIYSEPSIIEENKESYIEYCDWLGIESSKHKALIDELLSEYDLLSRKVDGVEYETREEADNARKELEEFIRLTEGVTINTEDDLHSIRQTVEQFQSRTKNKYIEFIEKELEEFDLRYRTIQEVVFESREEADHARNSVKQIEQWYQEATFNNAKDIQDLKNKIEKDIQSELKELYIDKLDNMYQVWEKAQNLCTEFPNMSMIGEDRINTSKKLYQALEVEEELKVYELSFPEFQEDLQNVLLRFNTINNVKYESVLKANMEYAKEVKHAISYFEYLKEKNNDKKSFFKKALNGVKGLVAKNYEDEYNYITNNGTMEIPVRSDWKPLIESMETDNKEKISQMQEAIKERYIRLTLPSEVLDKIIYSDSIIEKNKELSKDRIKSKIQSLFHGLRG